MSTTDSDKAWKKFGETDPYFGVLTHERFRTKNLNDEHKKEFFESGVKYTQRIYRHFKDHFNVDAPFKSVLDFGCGTGRLALGFAHESDKVVGIDISEKMLDEARKNAKIQGFKNVEFHLSDDDLSAVKNQQFDFVNTYIVLQHISPKRGMVIISQLLDRIKPGGYGMIQTTYSTQKGRLGKTINYFRFRYSLVHGLLNLVDKKKFNEPLMQMNEYDMSKVFELVHNAGVKQSFVQYTDHGSVLGVSIYLHKPKEN